MFLDYMETRLGSSIPASGDTEHRFDCPMHGCGDTRHRLYYHHIKKLMHCYNCGYSANEVKFVMDLEGVTKEKAEEIHKEWSEGEALPEAPYERLSEKLYHLSLADLPKQRHSLPKEYKTVLPLGSLKSRESYEYLLSRRVVDSQIIKHRFGYCPYGEYANRVVLPTIEVSNWVKYEEVVAYWQARSIYKAIGAKKTDESGNKVSTGLKVKNPQGNLVTVDKADVVFNLDFAMGMGYTWIVLGEGIFDALCAGVNNGENGAALMGKELSEPQEEKILRYVSNGHPVLKTKLEYVFIMLDSDAYEWQIKMAEKLSTKVDTFVCKIPYGDPNECGNEICQQVLLEAERYTPFFKIRSKLVK